MLQVCRKQVVLVFELLINVKLLFVKKYIFIANFYGNFEKFLFLEISKGIFSKKTLICKKILILSIRILVSMNPGLISCSSPSINVALYKHIDRVRLTLSIIGCSVILKT